MSNVLLKKAVAAAEKMVGKEMTRALANTFGSTTGRAEDADEHRKADLLAALTKLGAGSRIPVSLARAAAHGDSRPAPTMDAQEDAFEAIRAKAYANPADPEDERNQPPVKLDPKAIFEFWNRARAKRKTEG